MIELNCLLVSTGESNHSRVSALGVLLDHRRGLHGPEGYPLQRGHDEDGAPWAEFGWLSECLVYSRPALLGFKHFLGRRVWG